MMDHTKFITDYPELVVLLIGILFTLLIKLSTQPYKQLTTAIKALTTEVVNNHAENKKYREKDQEQVGTILDRLQKQETLCATVRSFCPHAHRRLDDPVTECHSGE